MNIHKIHLHIIDDKQHIIKLMKGSSTLNFNDYLAILKPIKKIFNDEQIDNIFSSSNTIDILNKEFDYLGIQFINSYKKDNMLYKYKNIKQNIYQLTYKTINIKYIQRLKILFV